MIKILKKYKLSIITILLGIGVVFVPNLVSYFNPNIILNMDKVLSSQFRQAIGWGLCSVGIVIGIIIYVYFDKIALIIIDGFDGTTLDEYKYLDCHKVDVHRYTITLNVNDLNYSDLVSTSVTIDKLFENYMNDRYSKFYFEGISYIPFIFYLGSKYGDDNKKYNYIHSFRTGKKQGLRKLKKNKNNSVHLIINDICHQSDDASKELIVRVSTSYKLNEKLDPFFEKMDVLDITSSELGLDIISNQTILDDWASIISNTIRAYSDKYDRLHLFLNTSSSLVFKLGTILNNCCDNTILVYHYNKKTNPTRQWSINSSEVKVDKKIHMTKK